VIESVHDAGMRLADTLGVSVYDAMILASALLAGCRTLVTEDLQHGQVVDGRLRIHNPFR
jgi:predicted nucleic acid-binding protein